MRLNSFHRRQGTSCVPIWRAGTQIQRIKNRQQMSIDHFINFWDECARARVAHFSSAEIGIYHLGGRMLGIFTKINFGHERTRALFLSLSLWYIPMCRNPISRTPNTGAWVSVFNFGQLIPARVESNARVSHSSFLKFHLSKCRMNHDDHEDQMSKYWRLTAMIWGFPTNQWACGLRNLLWRQIHFSIFICERAR